MFFVLHSQLLCSVSAPTRSSVPAATLQKTVAHRYLRWWPETKPIYVPSRMPASAELLRGSRQRNWRDSRCCLAHLHVLKRPIWESARRCSKTYNSPRLMSLQQLYIRLNSIFRSLVALIAIARSAAATIWVWQAWDQHGHRVFITSTPTEGPGGSYPSSAGCFTPESWNREFAKFITDQDRAAELQSLARQAKAMRILTIPLTVLYSLVSIALLAIKWEMIEARRFKRSKS